MSDRVRLIGIIMSYYYVILCSNRTSDMVSLDIMWPGREISKLVQLRKFSFAVHDLFMVIPGIS